MLKLTLFDLLDGSKNNTEIYVNINNISYFTRFLPYGCTKIVFNNGVDITVAESCEQILKRIQEFKIEI